MSATDGANNNGNDDDYDVSTFKTVVFDDIDRQKNQYYLSALDPNGYIDIYPEATLKASKDLISRRLPLLLKTRGDFITRECGHCNDAFGVELDVRARRGSSADWRARPDPSDIWQLSAQPDDRRQQKTDVRNRFRGTKVDDE
ncbi:unnamed protein product [Spodoptera exigua]|nr:unnamed protein product [Spodoptera exigua]